MKQKFFDAFFSDFFSRDFTSLILTKHQKNKKCNQFSIYLQNYLLFDETTRKKFFVDDDKNLNLKLFVDNDLHNLNINVIVFFIIIIVIVVFFFVFSFYSFSFFFFFFRFSEFRIEDDLRRNTILNVDAKFSLRRKTKIDRDDDAKTFEKTSENIVHIFIDVALNRSLRSVDFKRLTQWIKKRQNIYDSTSKIFENLHEIYDSIKLSSSNRNVFDLFKTFAFALFH